METKISNEVLGTIKNDPNRKNNHPTWPAFNVTWFEADAAARLLGGSTARLPHPEELDFATDLEKDYNPNGAAVASAEPRSVINAPERSPLGIFDLTGNGREWTDKKLTLKDGEYADLLRGHLSPPQSWIWKGLELTERTEGTAKPQVQRTNVASPYTPFESSSTSLASTSGQEI